MQAVIQDLQDGAVKVGTMVVKTGSFLKVFFQDTRSLLRRIRTRSPGRNEKKNVRCLHRKVWPMHIH